MSVDETGKIGFWEVMVIGIGGRSRVVLREEDDGKISIYFALGNHWVWRPGLRRRTDCCARSKKRGQRGILCNISNMSSLTLVCFSDKPGLIFLNDHG